MIRLSDVHYRYPTSESVLEGIDLSVDEGEYVFVCGPSGSGKSTLGYLLNGLIPHFLGGTLRGSVAVSGADTKGLRVSDLFSQVGLVLQNADAQLFNSTVENEIAFGLESLGLPGREIDQKIQGISETLHIEPLLNRSPISLSGGEKRLVAIASVLCLNPSLLVLDEPYAHLDWEGINRVREALREIHRRGKALFVIEQRLGGFLQDSTRCIIVNQGKLLFDGHPQEALGVLSEQHLIPRYPRRKKGGPHAKDPVLTVKDLSYRMESREILRGISFELYKGETVAIVGRNGAGKTTLIRHLNGLIRSARNEVTFMGKGIRGMPPLKMAAAVGISFQNPNDQFFKSRVRDELLLGQEMLGKEEDGWTEEIYTLFDLKGLLDRSPYQLSEGEKKRVALVSILTMRPQLLIIDEPTVGQDGRFREVLAGLLNELEDRGFTTLIVTHDLDFARATADRWIVLHDGMVVGDGAPDDLWRDEDLIQLGAVEEPEEGTRAGLSNI